MLRNCCGFVVKSCEIVAIFTPNSAKLLRFWALKKSEGARKVAVFAHILCDFGSQPTGSPVYMVYISLELVPKRCRAAQDRKRLLHRRRQGRVGHPKPPLVPRRRTEGGPRARNATPRAPVLPSSLCQVPKQLHRVYVTYSPLPNKSNVTFIYFE